MESLGRVTKLILDRVATIGIAGPLVQLDGVERIRVGSVRLVPVAAPHYPLALAGNNGPGAGCAHIQLVLTDRSPLTLSRDMAVIGTST